jgi:formate dehydrogenase assembly factor FdhD
MMKKSETHVAQGELQVDGEKLEALISLTPEQLEAVAAGFSISGAIFGFIASVRQLLNR